MAKRKCYFQCLNDGLVYGFPPPSYINYDKFCKWKKVLRKIDQEKDNLYIAHNMKLCSDHFEKHFIAGNNRLTRHAVPTVKLELNQPQQHLLCSFIEENAKLIMENHFSSEMLEFVRSKWRIIAPQLNLLGPMKSDTGWAEYLQDVMANLKTKEVIWTQEDDTPVVKNCDDFTELELKILQIWKKGTDNDLLESNLNDENVTDMQFDLEVKEGEKIIDRNVHNITNSNIDGNTENHIDSHIDGNIDSHVDSHSNNDVDSHMYSQMYGNTDDNTESRGEIITYSLYVETGGDTPLLQAPDIAPYIGPQYDTNVTCKCRLSDDEYQDEFEAFGKEIAHQLRNMPIKTATETQRQFMSILRSKHK